MLFYAFFEFLFCIHRPIVRIETISTELSCSFSHSFAFKSISNYIRHRLCKLIGYFGHYEISSNVFRYDFSIPAYVGCNYRKRHAHSFPNG